MSAKTIGVLSVPGKIYGRGLTETLMLVTEEKVSDEPGSIWKGKHCVNQIFPIKMLVEECLGKDEKLYAVHMDLENAYDKVDRQALWNVLKMYGVRGKLMEGIKVFYRETNVCVTVDGKLSDSFGFGVGVKQGCVMSLCLFNICMDE